MKQRKRFMSLASDPQPEWVRTAKAHQAHTHAQWDFIARERAKVFDMKERSILQNDSVHPAHIRESLQNIARAHHQLHSLRMPLVEDKVAASLNDVIEEQRLRLAAILVRMQELRKNRHKTRMTPAEKDSANNEMQILTGQKAVALYALSSMAPNAHFALDAHTLILMHPDRSASVLHHFDDPAKMKLAHRHFRPPANASELDDDDPSYLKWYARPKPTYLAAWLQQLRQGAPPPDKPPLSQHTSRIHHV